MDIKFIGVDISRPHTGGSRCLADSKLCHTTCIDGLWTVGVDPDPNPFREFGRFYGNQEYEFTVGGAAEPSFGPQVVQARSPRPPTEFSIELPVRIKASV